MQRDNVVLRVLNGQEAMHVQRYHTHPVMSKLGQTNGHHSAAVAMLIIDLHPAPCATLLRAAIKHDAGERFVGDLAAPAKRNCPELAELAKKIEDRMLRDHFIRGEFSLSPDEADWLKMCDMLECYMFASIACPDALDTPAWRGLRMAIVERSRRLIARPMVDVQELMELAKAKKGYGEPGQTKEYE